MKFFLKLFLFAILISTGWNLYTSYMGKKTEDKKDQEELKRLNILIEEASSGDPEKEFQVALVYTNMAETKENREKALYWLERSAQKGFSKALTQYMQIVILQLKANPESVKAEKLKSIVGPLAKKGDPEAQFIMYLLSTLSLFDKDQGLKYLDASAKQDFVPALIDTAKLLMRGEETPASRGLIATGYIEKALKIDANNTEAKILLGANYFDHGEYTKLLEIYNDEFLDTIHDKNTKSGVYHMKGIVSYEIGEWDDAIKYSKEAIAIGDVKQAYLTLFLISFRRAENLKNSISSIEDSSEKDKAKERAVEILEESKKYVNEIQSDPETEEILVEKFNQPIDTIKNDLDFKIESVKEYN